MTESERTVEASEIALDGQLLAAWEGGDVSAGESLIERYYDSIVRFFRTKTQTGWEDLVQRTFLLCAERRHTFRGESSFGAFLFGIARNVLFEHLRAVLRVRKHVVDFGVSSVVDLAPGASTAYWKKAEHRLLVEALRRIPLELQIAVELYYWEELSVADLAAVSEVPVGTVKSRLHRARLLLHEAMQTLPSRDEDRNRVGSLLSSWADGSGQRGDRPELSR